MIINLVIFFFGIPFEPPRAKITDSIFLFLITINKLKIEFYNLRISCFL